MAKPLLSTNNLRKNFGALTATDNVRLELFPGEIHALIGPNGAGKSTLIAQICGTLQPDSGTISFNGQDITKLTPHARARAGLGRSFQISQLALEFSALKNVMLAVQAKQGSSLRFFKPIMSDNSLKVPALEALDKVGLSTKCHVPAAELAHGEKRRLEIAIALASQSKALLLDEPMAGMGAEGSKDLTLLLAELKKTAPILLVEHDMDAVFTLADRISVLVYGKVIATGNKDEIRSNPIVRSAYIGEGQ